MVAVRDMVRCGVCRRPLSDDLYRARRLGPVCGGRIRAGWRPTAPIREAVEVDDGQLELDLAGAAG